MHHILANLQGIGIAVGLVLVGVWKILEHSGIVKKKETTASDMMAELQYKDHQIQQLHKDNGDLQMKNAELAAERSLSPVLDALERTAKLQDAVLERLVHHNGSFRHMETSLEQIGESLKVIVGYIVSSVSPKD